MMTSAEFRPRPQSILPDLRTQHIISHRIDSDKMVRRFYHCRTRTLICSSRRTYLNDEHLRKTPLVGELGDLVPKHSLSNERSRGTSRQLDLTQESLCRTPTTSQNESKNEVQEEQKIFVRPKTVTDAAERETVVNSSTIQQLDKGSVKAYYCCSADGRRSPTI